jgi:hypothetical protein
MKTEFDYNSFYPKKEQFESKDILRILNQFFEDGLKIDEDITEFARRCWAECAIYMESKSLQPVANEKNARYGIEDLHLSVNDIFEQLDEGYIGQDEAKGILTNCCKAFIKGDTL